MSWGLCALGLLLAYLVQSAVLSPFGPEWLDLLLVFALIVGLTAPVHEARLAGWITGLAQDVGTSGPLGLHAFALALAIIALTHLRELVNRELWWVRVVVSLIVAFPAQIVIQLHLRFWQGAALTWPGMLMDALVAAAVGALLAGLLVGLPGLLRRRPRRYRISRW